MPNKILISSGISRLLLILFATSLLTGCGVIQSNQYENMDSEERYTRLQTRSTDSLCHGYLNPIVQPKTLRQIRGILLERKVEQCKQGKRVVPLMDSEDPIASNQSISEEINPREQEPEVEKIETKKTKITPDFEALTIEDWAKHLRSRPAKTTTGWLHDKSNELARSATAKLKENRTDAIMLAVAASSINSYIIEMYGDIENSSYEKFKNANLKHREALEEGVHDPEVIEKSIANLKLYLPETQITKDIYIEVQVRQANAIERELITSAVKNGLKDPFSAKFRNIIMVGESRACVEVNAKNAFGGYTGYKALTVLAGREGQWITSMMPATAMDFCVLNLRRVTENP